MQLINIDPRALAPPPWYHVVPGDSPVLLVVEGSRIYGLTPDLAEECVTNEAPIAFLRAPGPAPSLHFPDYPTAISLNIAQSCNLSCTYCYADEGRFGSPATLMTREVAIHSIQQLLDQSKSATVSVGFIGGEPLLNRAVLHASVEYAAQEARRRAMRVTFGITTNATLLDARDLDLFRSYPFAVTVSLDGARDVNDALRRSHSKDMGFEAVVRRVRPLLDDPGLAQVTVRATITRQNLLVGECLDSLAAEGFRDIGISPLRTGPNQDLCLRERDWDLLLNEMKAAGLNEWKRVKDGGDFLFSNLATALKQLHRGSARALPCGSATNYVSVSARGDYYSCHRTVGQDAFHLGDSVAGPALESRKRFAGARHVDGQEPCRSCWARYLCGGGCHAEVIQAGRQGCDYIRGWLEFAISLYPSVLQQRPDLVQGTAQ